MYSNSCEIECDDYDDIGWWRRRIRTRRLGAGPKVTSGGNGDRDRSADAPVPGTELCTTTPAEKEKCSGSPGWDQWNATDVLDALECSGMHKRSDLMGQSPFGLIGINCSSFGALGFAPGWHNVWGYR